MHRTCFAFTMIWILLMTSGHADENNSPIRVGFVGLDSSHCIAFTEVLHREGNTGDIGGNQNRGCVSGRQSGVSAEPGSRAGLHRSWKALVLRSSIPLNFCFQWLTW